MTKRVIKIIDGNFAPDKSCSQYQEPTYIEWYFIKRLEEIKEEDIVVITDLYLDKVDMIKCKKKIAWLLEPPEINPNIYEYIKKNYVKFDRILTYKQDLIEMDNRFKYFPNGMCWIKKEDFKIYEKTKFCSMIASGKNITTGHKLRNEIIVNIRNKPIDIYGRIYNPLEYKLEGLRKYKFQIVVENSRENDYFTEKLIDCFVTGTVPIYWGCNNIGKYFDINGIIIFNNLQELYQILNTLKPNRYDTIISSIEINFEKAKKYVVPEDNMELL